METWKLKGGFELPRVGLGLGSFGGGRTPDYSNDKSDVQVMKDAIAMGYTHLDTSELSGGGHTEELVAEAIKDLDRSKLIIATKVWETHLGYDDLISAAKNSIKRLGVSYIDLYYIHYPNPAVPLKETIRAMDKLVDDGLVKNIGVSNFTLDLLIEAQSFTKHKIVAAQIEFSLLTRETGKYGGNKNMASKTVPYCQENDMLIVAERPLERGLLLEPNAVMDELIKKYNKTQTQVAINWLISQKNVVTIPMSHKIDHLKTNLGAAGWSMDAADIKKLGEAYRWT
ncbi:MAG: aldo/keto reductase [Candidatus Liptonbacteria bacterium]|nr:aldo/keto reductase [Candidatus Liptonbacteria bacterium]